MNYQKSKKPSIEFDPTKQWVFSKKDKLFTAFWLFALPAGFITLGIFPEHKVVHGVLVAFLGLFAMLPSLFSLLLYIRVQQWEKIKGTVVKSSIGSRVVVGTFNTLGITSHYPDIEYEYMFDNQKFRSSNFSIIDLDYHYIFQKQARQIQKDFSVGNEVDIWVNPKSPHRSIIMNKISNEHKTTFFGFIAIGLILMTFGLVYAYVYF